jgi:hypothetical protein
MNSTTATPERNPMITVEGWECSMAAPLPPPALPPSRRKAPSLGHANKEATGFLVVWTSLRIQLIQCNEPAVIYGPMEN